MTATDARHSINMISAVTAQSALRFAAYEGNLNQEVFIDFAHRLLHDAPGPVYLAVDGHPVHRGNTTKTFVASTNGRLRLVFLPGYAPELNPDEWVWKNVKHDRIACTGVTNAADITVKAIAALRRLQKTPTLSAASSPTPAWPTSTLDESTY